MNKSRNERTNTYLYRFYRYYNNNKGIYGFMPINSIDWNWFGRNGLERNKIPDSRKNRKSKQSLYIKDNEFIIIKKFCKEKPGFSMACLLKLNMNQGGNNMNFIPSLSEKTKGRKYFLTHFLRSAQSEDHSQTKTLQGEYRPKIIYKHMFFKYQKME